MCTHRLRHIRETNVEKFCHDRKITSKLSGNNVIKFMDDEMKQFLISSQPHIYNDEICLYRIFIVWKRFQNFLYLLSIS